LFDGELGGPNTNICIHDLGFSRGLLVVDSFDVDQRLPVNPLAYNDCSLAAGQYNAGGNECECFALHESSLSAGGPFHENHFYPMACGKQHQSQPEWMRHHPDYRVRVKILLWVS